MLIKRLLIILLLVLFVWIIQILFLHEVVNSGISGDDLNWLFYYHVYRGDLLSQFPFIWNDQTIYIKQQIYYIGIINSFFGFLNTPVFQLTQLLFKSLAALSLSFLVFSLSKKKILAIFTGFFFITSPSTTGVFEMVVESPAYLAVIFTSLFVFYYVQSVKNRNKILLASLFFFLALVSCPPRSFSTAVIPLLVELFRLARRLNPFIFLRRLLIFYLVPYLLIGKDAGHLMSGIQRHTYDFTAGNYYSIFYPIQILSSLFIDKSFLKYAVEYLGFFQTEVNLTVVLMLQIFLLLLSVFLGLIIKVKKLKNFVIKIMFFSLILEGIIYFLGSISHDLEFGLAIRAEVFFNTVTFLQASLGAYLLIFGFFLGVEWWRNQRTDQLMKILFIAWGWMIVSLFLIWISAGGVQIDEQTDRRYVLFISLGYVVFIAGILNLTIKYLLNVKRTKLKVLFFSLLGIGLLVTTLGNYILLYRHFYDKDQGAGSDYRWQTTMYNRFLNIFGKNNLRKDTLVYIDSGDAKNKRFYINSVGGLYVLVYFEDDQLIRGVCKAVIRDFQVLAKSYIKTNDKQGFIFDSVCTNPDIGQTIKSNYYTLDQFYAYSPRERQFLDIKEEILSRLDQNNLQK